MKNKLLAAVLVVTMCVIALVGCGSSGQAAATTAAAENKTEAATVAEKIDAVDTGFTRKTEEGTLTIGYLDGWQGTFDLSGENYMACGLVYDSLFTVDMDTNEIGYLLAESYEYVDDTHLKITLKSNAKFSSGDPVTAQDVLYSLKRIVDEGIGDTSLVSWIDFDNTKVDSDTQITIATGTPFAGALYMLASQTCGLIVSEKFAKTATADDWYNNPVGSGPYEVVSNTDAVGTVFKLREDYWDYDNLVTKADTIEIKYYSSNQTMMLDYESGILDMVIFADPNEYTRVANGELTDTVLDLKTVNDGCRVLIPYLKEQFKDERVRQAMSLALDTETICDIVWGDLAKPADSDFCSIMTYYESQGAHVYDVEKAKSLMTEAGFSASKPLELYLIVDPSAEALQVATVIQQMWSECYIKLTVEQKDILALIEGIVTGGFDFMIFPGSGVGVRYPYELISNYHPDGGPLEAITDEEWLEIRTRAITSLDPAEAEQAYHECQEWLVGKYYSIPIAEKNTIIMYRPYVKSIKTQGDYESFSLRFIEFN